MKKSNLYSGEIEKFIIFETYKKNKRIIFLIIIIISILLLIYSKINSVRQGKYKIIAISYSNNLFRKQLKLYLDF